MAVAVQVSYGCERTAEAGECRARSGCHVGMLSTRLCASFLCSESERGMCRSLAVHSSVFAKCFLVNLLSFKPAGSVCKPLQARPFLQLSQLQLLDR